MRTTDEQPAASASEPGEVGTEGGKPDPSARYMGKDNYGRPKRDYLTKIAAMDDKALQSETYSMIYQSARCGNNPRADWHWMTDACYDEATKRADGAPIYCAAFDECYRDHARD